MYVYVTGSGKLSICNRYEHNYCAKFSTLSELYVVALFRKVEMSLFYPRVVGRNIHRGCVLNATLCCTYACKVHKVWQYYHLLSVYDHGLSSSLI